MYGAILGDMIGMPYEFGEMKDKFFPLIGRGNTFTDDSVMTLAVADAILKAGRQAGEREMKQAFISSMQTMGRRYPDAGYGGMFSFWLRKDDPQPYNSYGNGAPMRVSPVAWFFPDSFQRALEVAAWSAEVTHNHPEGVKAAQAATAVIWMANAGYNKGEIRSYIEKNYYRLDKTCDQIRPSYSFDVSSQGTMPPAIQAFLEGENYEECVRLGVSLGGDSDTIGAITGGMAEAFYGMPRRLRAICRSKLYPDQLDILDRFEHTVSLLFADSPVICGSDR